MKIKWSKFSLFCISALLVTNAYCKSSDVLMPKGTSQKANIQQTGTQKPAAQKAKQQTAKSVPQTREEKIKAMVEANDKQAQKRQTEIDNLHHKNRIMKKNCGIAKNRLQDLMTTARIKIKTDSGSTRYMTQTEKAEKMKQTRQAIKRYCGQS